MKNSIVMVVVLALISVLSGLALGALNELTHEGIQNNILKFKKVPAVADIYQAVTGKLDAEQRAEVEEELLGEKRYVDVGGKEPLLVFVLSKDGKPWAVALEDYGQGFGGDLGVMVGFELATGNLVGIGITTMSETPGVGTKTREESFLKQFRGMSKDTVFKVRKDGGGIDAVSGATISSRAVAHALELARTVYSEHEAAIRAAIDQAPGGAQ